MPLIGCGDGNYALTGLKEIDVTKGFLGLDDKIKQCQTEETYRECRSKQYIETGVEKCKCIPFALRYFSKMVITALRLSYIVSTMLIFFK